MHARTTKITHPLGTPVETPLLTPSFSSKGFSFDSKDVSEVAVAFQVTKEFLTESLLISAYDIFHKHIPFREADICTDITIIDSGGYETSEVYDFSTTAKYGYPIKDWDKDRLKSVLAGWPKHKAAIIVSYDHGTERVSLQSQIDGALDFFRNYPDFLNSFLIKPETNNQAYIQIPNIIENLHQLKDFNIIGMTEKELGNSILQRMQNIAKIRVALSENGIEAPIHIFGSLDPVTSILYFLAGAEIFDGLTWLKYAYHEGAAIYQSNYGALNSELGIHIRDNQVRVKSIVNNIYWLEKMKYLMKDFVATENFSVFNVLTFQGDFGNFLEERYNTLLSNL